MHSLRQVAIILTNGINGLKQLDNLRDLLQAPGITELQVPAVVFDNAIVAHSLNQNHEANILDPGIHHIRIHFIAHIRGLGRLAFANIRSLHLEGLGPAIQAFWSLEPVIPDLRFLTLHFTKRMPLVSENDLIVTVVTSLASLARPIERFKINDPSGDLKLGFFIFHNFRWFANLRVFAIAAKTIPYNYVKDLAAALPLTVTTISIRIGCMKEEDVRIYLLTFFTFNLQYTNIYNRCNYRMPFSSYLSQYGSSSKLCIFTVSRVNLEPKITCIVRSNSGKTRPARPRRKCSKIFLGSKQ